MTEAAIQKIDGRTKAGRAAAAAASAAPVETRLNVDDDLHIERAPGPAPTRAAANRRNTRQTAPREPTRSGTRDAVVIGRHGEQLSRKRTSTGDIFDIPNSLIPQGWEYQWNAVSVVGNTEVLMDQNLMMAENGWRPVPADRYPGRFMPEGHKGSIIRGGQRLEERPKSLSDDARAEDIANARQLMSDRNDALKLSGVKKQMGDGFEMNRKYRGTGGDVRMSIDPALDIPSPSHQLAGGDE